MINYMIYTNNFILFIFFCLQVSVLSYTKRTKRYLTGSYISGNQTNYDQHKYNKQKYTFFFKNKSICVYDHFC